MHCAFLGVFSRPGRLHTHRKRLFGPARSFDRQFGLADGVRRGDNARFSSRRAPNDADRAVSSVRGVASGDRDAEYSGFCTVQAGVRWDGKGCPRLFMHGASIIMQDIKASYGRRSDRPYHAPKFAALFPRRARIRREEGTHTRAHGTEGIRILSVPMSPVSMELSRADRVIGASKRRLNAVYRRINTVHRSE